MVVLNYKYKYVGLLKFSDEHIKEISFIRRKKLRNYVIQVSTEKKKKMYTCETLLTKKLFTSVSENPLFKVFYWK